MRESIELLEASQLPQLAEAMDLTKTIDLSSTQGKGLLGRLAAAGGPGAGGGGAGDGGGGGVGDGGGGTGSGGGGVGSEHVELHTLRHLAMRVRSLHEQLEREEEQRQRAVRLHEATLAAVDAQRAAQRGATLEPAHAEEAERDMAQLSELAAARLAQLRAPEARGETAEVTVRLQRALAVQLRREAARLEEAPSGESTGRAAQRQQCAREAAAEAGLLEGGGGGTAAGVHGRLPCLTTAPHLLPGPSEGSGRSYTTRSAT